MLGDGEGDLCVIVLGNATLAFSIGGGLEVSVSAGTAAGMVVEGG